MVGSGGRREARSGDVLARAIFFRNYCNIAKDFRGTWNAIVTVCVCESGRVVCEWFRSVLDVNAIESCESQNVILCDTLRLSSTCWGFLVFCSSVALMFVMWTFCDICVCDMDISSSY